MLVDRIIERFSVRCARRGRARRGMVGYAGARLCLSHPDRHHRCDGGDGEHVTFRHRVGDGSCGKRNPVGDPSRPPDLGRESVGFESNSVFCALSWPCPL